jgi:hypothetical protein
VNGFFDKINEPNLNWVKWLLMPFKD